MKFILMVLLFVYLSRNEAIAFYRNTYDHTKGCQGVQTHGHIDAALIDDSGQLIRGFNTVGSLIIFNCHSGYVLSGSSVIECLNDGTYNASVPTCILAEQQCPEVTYSLPENTMIINVTNGNHVNSNVFYKCANGYEPQNKSYYRKSCLAISLIWEPFTDVPTCTPIKCTLPYDKHGNYIIHNPEHCYWSDRLSFQCEIVLQCYNGFKPNSIKTRTCLAKDTWSNGDLACEIIQCSKPDQISNGHYVYQGQELDITSVGMFDYGSYFDIKCDYGYTLTGPNRIACLKTGYWNNSYHTCILVQCRRPGMIENSLYYKFQDGGDLGSEFVDFNTTIFVNCKKGYTFESGSYIRTCLANGSWSGVDAKCTLVHCPIPVSNAYMYTFIDTKGSSNVHNSSSIHRMPYKTHINVSCHENFILIGNDELRCTENGTWDLSFPECQEVTITETTSSNQNALVGGVVGTVVVILIAGTISSVMMCRKRCLRFSDKENSLIARGSDIPLPRTMNQQQQINNELINIGGSSVSSDEQNVEYAGVPVEIVDLTLDVRDEDHTYYSYNLKKKPSNAIYVKTLSEFVRRENMTQNLETQFEKLSKEMLYDCSVAREPTNKSKNRYKNIYPYDQTRVILNRTDPNQSDYINASHIHGFHRVNAYIAAQAPLTESLSDFWSMVCDEGIDKIVMLTNLVEAGKVKCDQYWPEEQSSEYGNIVVTRVTTDTFSDFVIRTFTVMRNGTDKTVTQYHFTAWPDKGVPNNTSSLVHFRKKVKDATSDRKSPILVHCSAGIGRTGTFIALDILTDQAHALGYVDVVGAVDTLRKQRVNLVQTRDQYIFLHRAIIDTLVFSTSAIPTANFKQAYRLLLQFDDYNQKRKLDLEYEMMALLSSGTDAYQYVTAEQVRNRQKNRNSCILPVRDLTPGTTKADYIKAVFLPSYKDKKAFIVTQTPLHATLVDFWNVIITNNVHSIVIMNSVEETTVSGIYWPKQGETLSIDGIKITTKITETVSGHSILTLEIISQNKSRTIRQIQCNGWSSVNNIPDSPHTILTLIDIVISWQKQTGNQPVVVHCMNGVDKSALFCVVSAVIERMKIEQDVAITHVIQEMRNVTEDIISSVEQYQFCYEAVKAYMEQHATYSNFSLC